MRRNQALMFVLVCLPSTGPLAGCSGGTEFATVTGTVTFETKPIEQGTISFESLSKVEGAESGRRILTGIRDGKYKFENTDGAVPGRHMVRISAFTKSEGQSNAEPPGKAGKGEEPVSRDEWKEPENYIPAKYNTDTTLTVEIQAELNENVNFDLK